MAKRPVFITDITHEKLVRKEIVEFEWFAGFSASQKKKSIESFHSNALNKFPNIKILEVSSKSEIELGIKLSAFNLMIKTKNNKQFSVETAFQASKVFEDGGPFIDLYEKTSIEAKKDQRLKESGSLVSFQYFGRNWSLEPKTFFYDWLYINALYLNKDLHEQVLKFDAFTDIEFNPQKSINCQASSVATFVSLYKMKLLEEALSSLSRFKELIYGEYDHVEKDEEKSFHQLNIFMEE